MRNALVAFSIALVAVAISPQADTTDHAPTEAQCQADVRLWLSQVDDYFRAVIAHADQETPNRTDVSRLPIQQLSKRVIEMSDCESVDPKGADVYAQVENELESARKDRYESFVIRHKLEHQLFQEDAAGIR